VNAVYAVLAEDPSDVETLHVLVRRLCNNAGLPLKGKGYGGSGEMLRNGAHQLRGFSRQGCKRFIICYDADGLDPKPRVQAIMDRVITPPGSPRKIVFRSCLFRKSKPGSLLISTRLSEK
jgi:hypothetical protein